MSAIRNRTKARNSRPSRKSAAKSAANSAVSTPQIPASLRADAVTLSGARLDQARATLDRINLAALSIHGLAVDAGCASEGEAERYHIGIENSAVLICRYADLMDELLGGTGTFGNFADTLRAIPEGAEHD